MLTCLFYPNRLALPFVYVQFRGLDDELDNDELDNGETYDSRDDVIENNDYDDYHEKPDDDATSSLLSSDLAFYMPPESGPQPQSGGAGGASAASRKNRKSDKSSATMSSAKRSKGQSSENIKLVSYYFCCLSVPYAVLNVSVSTSV